METIKRLTSDLIAELGTASYLTQGSREGWFEYGRPGHPKDLRPLHHANNQTIKITELGNVAELTLGTGIHGCENRNTPIGVFINNP